VQAQCPQCAQRIVIDDAKVPDKPFAVKCPKCQTIVRLPGRAAPAAASEPELPSFDDIPAPPPAAAAPPPATAPAAVPAADAAALNEEMRAHMMAQLRREMGSAGAEGASHERALVCIPDRSHSAAITLALTRLGYGVDSVDEQDEGARLVEQGSYAVVAAARTAAAPGKGESPYQRIARLSPDQRRRLAVILVGDEFKTSDPVQAFAMTADIVVNGREAANADTPIRIMLTERKRLFQAYSDARRRFEASAT
jgi:predicted Zn finger-like uncharacterized protein